MKSTLPIAGATFACLLLGLVSCTMAPQPIAPRATIDRFLDFYFHEYGSGLPDAAQRATEGQRLTYRLHFEWREPGAAEASVLWTDEVTLQADDGRWLIDDFGHGGNWQFTVKGSMKKMLLNVAELCS